MPSDDVEVLDKVFEDAQGGHDYIVETPHGDITWEMHRVSRSRRQEFTNALPDELVNYMQDQADEKRDEHGVDELSSLDDIQEAEPDEAPPTSILGPDDVQRFEDLIVESFDHAKITDGELRDFLELWGDDQFYATGFLVVAISAEAEGVTDFRTDK